MMRNSDEIKIFYFRFMNNEIPLKDFEQWIYATPEIENSLGEASYFELVSFNFRQAGAKYEFTKLISHHIILSEFYTWQLRRILQNLLDDTLDPVDAFERLYDLAYSEGYYFLCDIGIQYVIWIDKIPKRSAQHLWDEKEYQRLREPLEKYLPSVKEEIGLMLQALDSGDLKVIDRGEYSYDTEYQISPEFAQKLKDFQRIRQLEGRKSPPKHQKKWWEFWK